LLEFIFNLNEVQNQNFFLLLTPLFYKSFYFRFMTEKKQLKYDRAYLKMALEWGKLSHCKRKQVGALIVKDRMIISDGFNGTPTGFDNCCENKEGNTKWEVLHAEANAILKVASSTQSAKNATLYITLSPCPECSKLIHQSGIKRVVYAKAYKDTSGLYFLEKAGVELNYLPYE
jgi:dCMP deaminase